MKISLKTKAIFSLLLLFSLISCDGARNDHQLPATPSKPTQDDPKDTVKYTDDNSDFGLLDASEKCLSQSWRLPTARDLAQFASNHGAAGTQETAYKGLKSDDPKVKDEIQNMEKLGYGPIFGRYTGGALGDRSVDFYYSNRGYLPDKTDNLDSVWTSTVINGGGRFFYYKFDRQSGELIADWYDFMKRNKLRCLHEAYIPPHIDSNHNLGDIVVDESNELFIAHFDEAIKYCKKIGGRLPTAREAASYAQKRGAIGITEVSAYIGGVSGYLVSALNMDGTIDLFYFNWRGFKAPQGNSGRYSSWTFSAELTEPTKHYVKFNGYDGRIDYGIFISLDSNPVRCWK